VKIHDTIKKGVINEIMNEIMFLNNYNSESPYIIRLLEDRIKILYDLLRELEEPSTEV
jgi:hypothetical protein